MTGTTFDPEIMTVSCDAETHRRLSEGTPFQRTTNALAMINDILAETDMDIIIGAGIPKKAHKKFLKKLEKTAWIILGIIHCRILMLMRSIYSAANRN